MFYLDHSLPIHENESCQASERAFCHFGQRDKQGIIAKHFALLKVLFQCDVSVAATITKRLTVVSSKNFCEWILLLYVWRCVFVHRKQRRTLTGNNVIF